MIEEELAEAKEIIKELLISFDKNGLLLDGFESSLKIIKKAEDFIKG